MVRKREGGVLVLRGRDLGWGCGKLCGNGGIWLATNVVGGGQRVSFGRIV